MAKDLAYEQQMFLLVEQWKESGISIKAFCEQNSLRYHAFHYWFKRYKQESSPEEVKHVFTPIKIQPAPIVSSPFAEVIFPAGHQIRLLQSVTHDYLKALIK